ncbi:solute carrier family 35 member G1-like [Tigriopus californicus]|uniref:solute carrier family 35 member G1-like n=1 Tax=Tigriopus californicus TaxID=6832 RepID=UPI0027DA874F|nr:solute carrier family 35 member G1-like [Tigriopus californicus]
MKRVLVISLLSATLGTFYGVVMTFCQLNPVDVCFGRGILQTALFGFKHCISTSRSGKDYEQHEHLFSWIASLLSFLTSYLIALTFTWLPLGDAAIVGKLTIVFTALFARILSNCFIPLNKVFCFVSLMIGQICVLQPSFLFGWHEALVVEWRFYVGSIAGLFASMGLALVFVLVGVKLPNVPKELILIRAGGLHLITWTFIRVLLPEITGPYPLERVGLTFLSSGLIVLSFYAEILALEGCSPVLVSLLTSLDMVFSFIIQVLLSHQSANYLNWLGVGMILISTAGASYIDNEQNISINNYQGLIAKNANSKSDAVEQP